LAAIAIFITDARGGCEIQTEINSHTSTGEKAYISRKLAGNPEAETTNHSYT